MLVLVIGGTRSGKSEVAERYAARLGATVTVVIPRTAPGSDDADFASRVAAHIARRPATWTTVECGDRLPDALLDAHGVVLIDSLGTWVANARDFAVDTEALLRALQTRTDPTVIVTEEVGLAIHSATPVGRLFTDRLGELNTAVAAIADSVLLVVAGRVLRLEPADSVSETA